MEGTIPTPPASSTVTSTSTASLQLPPFQLLEITLISAHDLPRISNSMKTYAVAYLHPTRKLTTRVNSKPTANPNWNEKLFFRIDEKFLQSENASLTIEIYTVSWFRDILVGVVRVLIDDLIMPSHKQFAGKRFVKLQIRRPNGSPQGILNMGFCLGNVSEQKIPLRSDVNGDEETEIEVTEDEEAKERKIRVHEKVQLWRSRSVNEIDEEEDFTLNPGSVCNGSAVNGSELCSDVGPSASIVAAELAKKTQAQPQRPPAAATAIALPPRAAARAAAEAEEMGSSILEELTMEEAMAKGWRVDFGTKSGGNREVARRNPRRHSDGGGLFSCFGNAYGIEFHIVCGGNKYSNAKGNNSRNKRRKRLR